MGFGLSFGRDLYHKSKENAGVMLLFACLSGLLLCAYFAGRGLTRGHDRNFWGRTFLIHIGNYLLIIASFSAVEAILFFIMMLFAGKMIEAAPNLLVFMVVGRRGKRAYIDLDQDGRMLFYSGIL